MSPQRSNRDALLEGALRCVERLPAERVTARAIAHEAAANIASINYHFGSKEALVTAAVVEGLDRWLAEVAERLDQVAREPAADRLLAAAAALDATGRPRAALARHFVLAIARAAHDHEVRQRLLEGFRRTRPAVAALLGLGADPAGEDAAGLVHAMFTGLLLQALLDPSLRIDGQRLADALGRLGDVLPGAR